MPPTRDAATSSTRLAANVAAGSVLVYALLWVLTTQVDAIRAISPFADDPWDAVASYAAIFLPIVAGATWVRSLRHRGPVLSPATARRIRWGSGLAVAIVLSASAVDAQALGAIGVPPAAGGLGVLVEALVVTAIGTALVGLGLTARAAVTARILDARPRPGSGPMEPDIVDDLLALGLDLSTPIGLRPAVETFSRRVETFLEESAFSPRRHRIAFGALLALGSGLAFSAWHAIREGPSPSLVVPIAFLVLFGAGVLAIWLGAVGPLRLLRSPRS